MMVDIVILLLLTAAMVYDLKYRRIPLFISLPLLVMAVLLHRHPEGFLAWPVLYFAWRFGTMGGGDAKVLMAMALLWGPVWAAVAMLLGGLLAFFHKPAPGMIGSCIVGLGYIALTFARFCGIM